MLKLLTKLICAQTDNIFLNFAYYPLNFIIQNAKNLIEIESIRQFQLFALRFMLYNVWLKDGLFASKTVPESRNSISNFSFILFC